MNEFNDPLHVRYNLTRYMCIANVGSTILAYVQSMCIHFVTQHIGLL